MRATAIEKTLISSDGTLIYSRAILRESIDAQFPATGSELSGARRKQSIVFVHGCRLSSRVFDRLMENPALGGYDLVAYDTRGHGRSGRPDDAGHASKYYADDFSAVVETFGLSKPLIVGWSLGGTIACDICAHLPPNTLSGVVYAAGIPYTGAALSVATPLSLSTVAEFHCPDDLAKLNAGRLAFIDALFNDPDKVPLPVKHSWLACCTLQAPEDSLRVVNREQDPAQLWKAAKNGLPALVIGADKDLIIRCDVVEQTLKEHFVNLEAYTVVGGSHAMFYDQEEEFVRVLVRFARKVNSSIVTAEAEGASLN